MKELFKQWQDIKENDHFEFNKLLVEILKYLRLNFGELSFSNDYEVEDFINDIPLINELMGDLIGAHNEFADEADQIDY